jgi:H+-transporting ATPase
MATYENGDAEKDVRRDTIGDNDGADMGEYGNLVRYISTYRDGRRGSTASGGGAADPHEKKKGFFSRKKKGEVSGVFETPDDWLTTDMKAGLRSSDVETRRRKTGWNELTTEKENLFLKFIGFFKGPVLYGTFFSFSCNFSFTRFNSFNSTIYLHYTTQHNNGFYDFCLLGGFGLF